MPYIFMIVIKKNDKIENKIKEFNIKEDVILSLDQSSTNTGFAFFNKEKKLLEYGLIKSCNKDTFEERIFFIVKTIKELTNNFNITAIVCEDVQSRLNASVLIKLSKLLGMIEFISYEKKIPFTVLHPNTWKSRVGIKAKKREEIKIAASEKVEELFKVTNIKDDTAEAILIGLATKEEDLWKE